MPLVTGTNPEQVPVNGMLGSMAYQEHDNANIVGGRVAAILATTEDGGYPDAKASLVLDFTNSRTLDGRINFSRNSIGSYFDKNGVLRYALPNEARFDHNPLTGELKGLLFEPARTNLFLRSAKFDAPEWAKSNVTVTPNSLSAPTLNLTADKITEDTANASHTVVQSATVTSASHTISVFAKRGERNLFFIRDNLNGTANNTFFDLAAGTILSVPSDRTATIESVGFGWYRCTVTSTAVAASRSITFGVTNENGVITYTGDGVSGLFIWGAQLELGGFATSYIPTDLATVARAVDGAILQGKYFSDLYNFEEGALFANLQVDKVIPSDSGTGVIVSVGDAARQNYVELRATTSNGTFQATSRVSVLNTIEANSTAYVPLTTNELLRFAAAYRTNDFADVINTRALETDSILNTPRLNVDRVEVRLIGTGSGAVAYLKEFRYFPMRLKNEALQFLTAAK